MRRALLASLLTFPLLATACGDDEDAAAVDDPRRDEISGVAELAIGAYASVGPEALADYMSEDALQECPREQLQIALADEPVPTGFKQLKGVNFDGDTVQATITISTKDGDKDIDWTYVEEDGNWRISDMPGLEECG
jgi:hypothetical protein